MGLNSAYLDVVLEQVKNKRKSTIFNNIYIDYIRYFILSDYS